MHCWNRVFLVFLVAVLLGGHAAAYDYREAQDAMENALTGESRELLHGVSVGDDQTLLDQILKIVENGAGEIRKSWTAGLAAITKVSVVALLCGSAEGLRIASGTEKEIPILSAVGTLAIASVVLLDLNGMMMLCRETIESVSVFSKTMIPVMAAAVSISGAPARAAAMQAVTMLSLDLMIRMITGVLMPAVCIYLAIMTVNYALGQNILRRTGDFIVWLVKMILKASMTLFVSYLTISGIFSGSADGVAVKTAKAALSGMVPVVGGVISDATESLLAGAAVIRRLTGVFGVFCIIAICLIPFVKMGINYLLFKGGTAVLSIFCSKEITGYLSALSDSFGMLLGMLGTCVAILFFEIVFSIVLIGG